jgi:hypothetical protein
LRYRWVVAKLVAIVSVMVMGGVVIGPALNTMLNGGGDTTPQFIAAAAYDVLAMATATAFAVFKPGRPFRLARSVKVGAL